MQLDALARIRSNLGSGHLLDGGRASYRRINDFLKERYTTGLSGAVWELDDAGLMPSAGACTACPKRSGKTPELFADIVDEQPGLYGNIASGPDVCTDPDCYGEKKKLQLKRDQAALEADGYTVIAGGAARSAVSATGHVKGAYISVDDVPRALKQTLRLGQPTAPLQLDTVLIQDPRTGKTFKAVRVADLKARGVAVKASSPQQLNEAERERRDGASRRHEEKWSIESIARRKLLDVVRAKILATPRSTLDFRTFAQMAYAHCSWYSKPLLNELWGASTNEELKLFIDLMPADDAQRFALDCALLTNVVGPVHAMDHEPDMLLKFAKHYGVDVVLARIGGLTPTPAAQAITRPAGTKIVKKSRPAGASALSKRPAGVAVKSKPKAKPKPKPGQKPKRKPKLIVKDDAGVAVEKVTDDAGVAVEKVTDDAGVAGGGVVEPSLFSEEAA